MAWGLNPEASAVANQKTRTSLSIFHGGAVTSERPFNLKNQTFLTPDNHIMSSSTARSDSDNHETKSPSGGDNTPVFKIFVGGIDPTVTAPMMIQQFSSFGRVTDATIMMDRITGRARGFGFVQMGDQEGYDAVLGFSNHMFNGKKVDVKPSFENSPPTAGTGGPYSASKNLHVSNLGPNTTVESIEEFFKPHCEVKEVVIKNGFAFVNTGSIQEATGAMNALQGAEFLGLPLTINYAKDYSQKVSFFIYFIF
jgi:RNA recognition motif-containing protein